MTGRDNWVSLAWRVHPDNATSSFQEISVGMNKLVRGNNTQGKQLGGVKARDKGYKLVWQHKVPSNPTQKHAHSWQKDDYPFHASHSVYVHPHTTHTIDQVSFAVENSHEFRNSLAICKSFSPRKEPTIWYLSPSLSFFSLSLHNYFFLALPYFPLSKRQLDAKKARVTRNERTIVAIIVEGPHHKLINNVAHGNFCTTKFHKNASENKAFHGKQTSPCWTNRNPTACRSLASYIQTEMGTTAVILTTLERLEAIFLLVLIRSTIKHFQTISSTRAILKQTYNQLHRHLHTTSKHKHAHLQGNNEKCTLSHLFT